MSLRWLECCVLSWGRKIPLLWLIAFAESTWHHCWAGESPGDPKILLHMTMSDSHCPCVGFHAAFLLTVLYIPMLSLHSAQLLLLPGRNLSDRWPNTSDHLEFIWSPHFLWCSASKCEFLSLHLSRPLFFHVFSFFQWCGFCCVWSYVCCTVPLRLKTFQVCQSLLWNRHSSYPEALIMVKHEDLKLLVFSLRASTVSEWNVLMPLLKTLLRTHYSDE